jgi:hypothetical protein
MITATTLSCITCTLFSQPNTVTHGLELFKSFFHNFRALDDEIGKDLHL